MDFIPKEFATQFPYVVLLCGLFWLFWSEMKKARRECDERSERRDKVFAEVIDRNTRAIDDLDRTVQQIRFSQPANDRRVAWSEKSNSTTG